MIFAVVGASTEISMTTLITMRILSFIHYLQILLDAPSITDAEQKPSKNRECVDQAVDLALSNRYTEVISQLQSPKTPLQPTNVNRTEQQQTTQQCEP